MAYINLLSLSQYMPFECVCYCLSPIILASPDSLTIILSLIILEWMLSPNSSHYQHCRCYISLPASQCCGTLANSLPNNPCIFLLFPVSFLNRYEWYPACF